MSEEEENKTEKKINSKAKKYKAFLKKVQKEHSQTVKRLDAFMKKTNELLFQYPLNEDKNRVLKVRSLKHLEFETIIKMMRFKVLAVEKILEVLESRSLKKISSKEEVEESEEPPNNKNEEEEEEEEDTNNNIIEKKKKNKIRICRTVEVLLNLFNPTIDEIMNKTPKTFFDELGCIEDFETEIRSIHQQELSERASLKGVKLKRPSDIRKETYINDGLFNTFVEICENRVSALKEEVKKKLDLVDDEEYNFHVFDNVIKSFFFHEMKVEYEEKLRVHIENPNSRINRFIESVYSNLSEEKTKNIRKGKRLVHIKLYKDGYSFDLGSVKDRRFISILQNAAIKYLIKDVFLKHVEETSREEDKIFLKSCNLLNEVMDNFGPYFIENNDGIFGTDLKFLFERSVEKELEERKSFQESIDCVSRLDMNRYGINIFDPMEIIIILCQTCCVLATVSRRVCLRNGETKWEFGADNFFPSLTYVLIRAKIPQFCTLLIYARLFFSSNFYLYQDWVTNKSELKYYLTVFDSVKDFIKLEGKKIIDDPTPILDWLVARNTKRKEDIKYLDDQERGLFLRNNLFDFEIKILRKREEDEEDGDDDDDERFNIFRTSLVFVS